jgi:ankyrin repeat protein
MSAMWPFSTFPLHHHRHQQHRHQHHHHQQHHHRHHHRQQHRHQQHRHQHHHQHHHQHQQQHRHHRHHHQHPNHVMGNSAATAHQTDPIFRATCNNDHDEIRALVASRVDVNTRNYLQYTPLYVALRAGATQTCLLLLDLKADPNTGGIDVLHYALNNRVQTRVVKALLDNKADINRHANTAAKSPLMVASNSKIYNNVQALLNAGADPNYGSPLLKAALNGSADIAMLLLDSNASINSAIDPSTRMTALHAACQVPHSQLATLLIARNTDIHARDRSDQTPLHLACARAHSTAALALIEQQADINATDSFQRTPLHWASNVPLPAQAMLDRKADINARDCNNWTPLHYAYRYAKNLSVVELLLMRNADIEVRSVCVPCCVMLCHVVSCCVWWF